MARNKNTITLFEAKGSTISDNLALWHLFIGKDTPLIVKFMDYLEKYTQE
jgi:hypothetical protein